MMDGESEGGGKERREEKKGGKLEKGKKEETSFSFYNKDPFLQCWHSNHIKGLLTTLGIMPPTHEPWHIGQALTLGYLCLVRHGYLNCDITSSVHVLYM